MPVAVETLGAAGPRSFAFLKELAARMRRQSGEERAFQYLMQQLSVAVQRGNAVAVGGTVGGMVLHIRHFCWWHGPPYQTFLCSVIIIILYSFILNLFCIVLVNFFNFKKIIQNVFYLLLHNAVASLSILAALELYRAYCITILL